MTSRSMDASPDDRCSSLARYINPMSRTALSETSINASGISGTTTACCGAIAGRRRPRDMVIGLGLGHAVAHPGILDADLRLHQQASQREAALLFGERKQALGPTIAQRSQDAADFPPFDRYWRRSLRAQRANGSVDICPARLGEPR